MCCKKRSYRICRSSVTTVDLPRRRRRLLSSIYTHGTGGVSIPRTLKPYDEDDCRVDDASPPTTSSPDSRHLPPFPGHLLPPDTAFPVTAARAWNALPSSVRSASSLLQFRRDLKTALHVSVIVLFAIVSSRVTDCNF